MGNRGDRSSRSPADLPGQRYWQAPSATEQDGWYDAAEHDGAEYNPAQYGPDGYDVPGYDAQGYDAQGYDTEGRDPVRGYPPGPDHADPVYSPGQFVSWDEHQDQQTPGYQDAHSGGYQQEQDYGYPQERNFRPGYPEEQSYGFPDESGYQGQQGYQDQQGYRGEQGYQGQQGYRGEPSYQDQQSYRGQQDYPMFGDDEESAPRSARRSRGAPGRGLISRTGFSSAGLSGIARSRTTLLSVAAGVVAIALAVTAYVYLSGSKAGASATTPAARQSNAQSAAPAASPAAALGKWGHVGSRTTDPVPLTLAELYPAQFVINGVGVSFTRATVRSDTDCARALFGTQLQSDAKKGHCTQVMRASYVTGDGRVMGTIGVVNLSTAAAAAAVGKVSGADEFIGPLSSAHGPTRKMAQGTGVVQAAVKGHYLILTFAEFTNLKSPSTSAARQQLLEFSNDLVTGSANISLSTRMVKGTPGGTAP